MSCSTGRWRGDRQALPRTWDSGRLGPGWEDRGFQMEGTARPRLGGGGGGGGSRRHLTQQPQQALEGPSGSVSPAPGGCQAWGASCSVGWGGMGVALWACGPGSGSRAQTASADSSAAAALGNIVLQAPWCPSLNLGGCTRVTCSQSPAPSAPLKDQHPSFSLSSEAAAASRVGVPLSLPVTDTSVACHH